MLHEIVFIECYFSFVGNFLIEYTREFRIFDSPAKETYTLTAYFVKLYFQYGVNFASMVITNHPNIFDISKI